MREILAADIGGTNSRFAHFEVDSGGEPRLIRSQWLKTQDSSSFANLLGLLKESDFSLPLHKADIAVIAVAGPVKDSVYSSPPFISWDIDLSDATEKFGFRRYLLVNDFVIQAFACRSPAGKEAVQILEGRNVPEAARAVIGAGTALGKAALVSDGAGGYVAVPSEGGHAGFPFVSRREFEFQEFLTRELQEDYITANTVVSGKGLSLIHHFLTGKELDPREVAAQLSPSSETLAWAARFYGRACRHYALEVLALGGVYVAGGVAARTPMLLTHDAFAAEFRSSKTMSDLLADIPIFLMKNQESGLWGAALLGCQELRRSGE